jgi:hypothetical protein
MKPCDEMIQITLALASRMAEVADEGDRAREDAGCGVLYGVLRDSAYKIKQLAEAEWERHQRKSGRTR